MGHHKSLSLPGKKKNIKQRLKRRLDRRARISQRQSFAELLGNAADIMAWLEEHSIHVMKWSPCSPDMTPFDVIKDGWGHAMPSSEKAL